MVVLNKRHRLKIVYEVAHGSDTYCACWPNGRVFRGDGAVRTLERVDENEREQEAVDEKGHPMTP